MSDISGIIWGSFLDSDLFIVTNLKIQYYLYIANTWNNFKYPGERGLLFKGDVFYIAALSSDLYLFINLSI